MLIVPFFMAAMNRVRERKLGNHRADAAFTAGKLSGSLACVMPGSENAPMSAERSPLSLAAFILVFCYPCMGTPWTVPCREQSPFPRNAGSTTVAPGFSPSPPAIVLERQPPGRRAITVFLRQLFTLDRVLDDAAFRVSVITHRFSVGVGNGVCNRCAAGPCPVRRPLPRRFSPPVDDMHLDRLGNGVEPQDRVGSASRCW